MYYDVLTPEENYLFFLAAVSKSVKHHERSKLYAELLSKCGKDKVILAQCTISGLKDPITYLIEDFASLDRLMERIDDGNDAMLKASFCYGQEIFDSSD